MPSMCHLAMHCWKSQSEIHDYVNSLVSLHQALMWYFGFSHCFMAVNCIFYRFLNSFSFPFISLARGSRTRCWHPAFTAGFWTSRSCWKHRALCRPQAQRGLGSPVQQGRSGPFVAAVSISQRFAYISLGSIKEIQKKGPNSLLKVCLARLKVSIQKSLTYCVVLISLTLPF